MRIPGIALALLFCLAPMAMADAAYSNAAFGYRLQCPSGWVARADGDAATVMLALASGPMKARITTGKRPAAVTEAIGDRMRQRDEAALAQRAARWKRVPFAAPAPGSAPGARWALAYRTPAGSAEISVASLFSYPHAATGEHVWVRMQLVAPLAKAKEAGGQMRALLAAFAPGTAGAVDPGSVTVVGKAGPSDMMRLSETASLAKITFEPAPLQAELGQYQTELFQPTVALEARLAQLFDDVTAHAERKEITETGRINAFREIVGRYKKLVEPLEASVPTNPELAKAHEGVVAFYRERAGIYERIVEASAIKDQAALTKAAQELSQHAFQNTVAYQQLNALAAPPPTADAPPPLQ